MDRSSPADDIASEANEASPDQEALFKKLKNWFLFDYEKQADWREAARQDFAFTSDDQLPQTDKQKLRDVNRPIIIMNRVEPIIDSVPGSKVANRQEVQFIPWQQGSVQVNEVLTSAAKWFRDQCDAEDEESDAFREMVICSKGWCLSADAMVRLPNTHFATTPSFQAWSSTLTWKTANG
jgi:hypothetical protein